MDPADRTDLPSQIVQAFAAAVQPKQPDYTRVLHAPLAELQQGLDQATALYQPVVRPNSDQVDAQAVGRLRFPDVQGVLASFAEALDRNPDVAQEAGAGAADLRGAVALDQAVGRLIFCGQLFWDGGETGAVLCGATGQQLCGQCADQARAFIQDVNQDANLRSDMAVAFAEPFRLIDDARARARQAQAGTQQAGQAYQDQIGQVQADTTMTKLIEAFMGGSTTAQGGTTP